MSLKIFERAKRYVDKVMLVKDSHTQALDFIEGSNYQIVKKNYLINRTSLKTRDRNGMFSIQMQFALSSLAVSAPQALRVSYHRIDDDNDFPCSWVPKKVQVLTEFKEDLDFQLSTVMNDDILLEYYVCCLLYTRGFRGYIKRMMSHHTLNAIKKHIDLLISVGGRC